MGLSKPGPRPTGLGLAREAPTRGRSKEPVAEEEEAGLGRRAGLLRREEEGQEQWPHRSQLDRVLSRLRG